MSNYNILAQYYDELTIDVDYEVRSDYISDFFKANNPNTKTVLDLACGTGSISKCLIQKGYDITGIDLSEDMLSIAYNKLSSIGNNFSLLNADITEFSLENKFDACICALDSINHLDGIESVKKAFQCVYDSLNEKGTFVFDVNTIYKHQEILGDNTFVFDEEDYFLSWDNELIDDYTVRILLDFFIYNGKSYDRYSEEIIEIAYSINDIVSLLEEIGFVNIKCYDELTLDEPKEDSQRLYFVCQRG